MGSNPHSWYSRSRAVRFPPPVWLKAAVCGGLLVFLLMLLLPCWRCLFLC